MILAEIFASVFDTFETGICLLSPTPDGIILAINDALLMATGRQREDLIGISIFCAFPANPDDPCDTGEASFRASLQHVIASGKSDWLLSQRYSMKVLRPDGTYAYEERFWNATTTPLFDKDGTLVCVAHSTLDITPQVKAETAQRESEMRLRAFVSATSDVVYRMSPDWSHMHQFDGRGFLKSTHDWAKYDINNFVPPDDLMVVQKVITQAISTRSVFALEHRVIRQDGSLGWTFSRAVPIMNDRDEITEWIGAASDITERKQNEIKLQESDRRKDEFLAMLAHELRNPLAPISAAASILRLPTLNERHVKQTSEIIHRQVKHMAGLVDDLLDVSRVTRGAIVLEKTGLDFHRIVADAVEQVNPLIQTRRHHLTVRVPPDTALVFGDRKRLVQVITNILGNAAKYTPEGGNILLNTDVGPDNVVLTVQDDGIGMADELLDRAFELFAQAERTSDRSSGGLGLGLALVKSLVELHGGTVTCCSAGKDLGSRFTVSLPRFIEYDKKIDRRPVKREEIKTGRSLKILIVDDNVDAAQMLAVFLESLGHTILIEYESIRALERAREGSPDVCLLDIGLPEMDGNELAQRLRQQPETTHAVLIAVTGYGQEEDRKNSFASGFDHHLVKPVDLARVSALLAGIDAQRANTAYH